MEPIDINAARAFLGTAYQPNDCVAVLLKYGKTTCAAQRIVPVSLAMSSEFHDWLTREHDRRNADVFISVNAFSSRLASRCRLAVAAIRHVFVDADRDSAAVLAAISVRRDLPLPSYVVHSSTGRAHILWRVTGFTIARLERVQKLLAKILCTDAAATSAAQLTRLPGYWNHKRQAASLVTVDYRDVDAVHSPGDFPTAPDAVQKQRRSRSGFGGHAIERARRYVAAVPPAIAGQHGDILTFRLCCRLVRGFALSDDEALALLHDWNAGCKPPWSPRELAAKLRHARRYGNEPLGSLLANRP